jgi:nucleoid DNA-binding protein
MAAKKVKKVTKAKATTKKTAKVAKCAKVAKVTKARTKSEIVNVLAEAAELTRKDVNVMFDVLSCVIKTDLGKSGPGVFTVPGLMKIRVIKKPATKARKGTNPFTGEPMTFKAKPARNIVRIRPLTALKSMV